MASNANDAEEQAELTSTLRRVGTVAQQMIRQYLDSSPRGTATLDPFNLARPLMEMTRRMIRNPADMVAAQMELASDYWQLAASVGQRMIGLSPEPVAVAERGDRRFKHEAWQENIVFDFIKQSYLLTAGWLEDQLSDTDGLNEKDAARLQFFTRQFVDALSPTNFALTNPEVLEATVETRGQNLIGGLRNLLADLEQGNGSLRISQTDFEAFEVGRNVATAPGKVVFQNDLIQLLQFEPTTDKTYQRPLLIIPPWINKYYILDLREDNSFIRWAVGKGYTVFVTSWVNPAGELAEKTFEDYLNEGVFAALDAVHDATGEKKVNCIGYCIGGTLLATALAYMAAVKDDRVASATFFAAQVDFSEPGELEVFIGEEQIRQLDERMRDGGGFLDGKDMATTFNMLRANDLIWSFVVNNYLLGKSPPAFDLLYWNADATRMPRAMHVYYLREMYQHNRLVEKDALNMNGVPIDLRKIKTPVFIQSAELDHIAPYSSVYKATQLYSGPIKFILAGSGHIAGVVNPPSANKYGYRTNDELPPTAREWVQGSEQHEGSWWPAWHSWLSRRSGKKVKARKPGSGELAVIEDAPGSYVLG